MEQEQLLAMGVGEEQIEGILALHLAAVRQQGEEAAQWRARCEAFERERGEEERRAAVERAIAGLRFSSKGAKSAFLQSLSQRELPIGETGLDPTAFGTFLEEYRQDDPEAFLPKTSHLRFVTPTPGAGTPAADSHSQANEALRRILGKI